ncbi:MAG: carboxymuconolactone decarboxylase family protein [Caldilineaceae bacterium]|nr:carboxymuconolactone decarboxylase family protein [Caldilineaceae bacterium]
MSSYTALHMAAVGEGELSTKIKELMALSIGIVLQCDGCMLYHLRNALQAGANAQEVYEAANVAIMMGGGPAAVYAAKVEEMLAGFEEGSK